MPTPGGNDPHPLPAADEDALMRLFEGWERLAEDEDILPPLSPLASRLLAVEHEDAQAITELTQIVESDPILTGRILGLANSVMVRARSKPIFEVVGAVIRLGVNAVFEAAFAQIAATSACRRPPARLCPWSTRALSHNGHRMPFRERRKAPE